MLDLLIIISCMFIFTLYQTETIMEGTIRTAELEDAEIIKNLGNKYVYDCYINELKSNKDAILRQHSINTVKEIIKEGNTFVYDDGIVRGFISLHKSDMCSIILLYVDFSSRRSRIGYRLLEHVLSLYDLDYCLTIDWYNPMKSELIKYYNKYGFTVVEEKEPQWIKMTNTKL
jgi:N-acetylglutamate synthase-like GNAT family acetyltransferase